MNYNDLDLLKTFAEYEPVDIETAFRHKNGLEPSLFITTRGRPKVLE